MRRRLHGYGFSGKIFARVVFIDFFFLFPCVGVSSGMFVKAVQY